MSVLDLTAASFSELEAVIERGLGTFVEVGTALAAIRERRLYRETHGDFDTYCRERWGWSARHVNRQIEAATVVAELGPIGPTNEAQARELARVEPERRAEVWEKASANGAPTAAAVKEVAAHRPAARSTFNQVNENIGWARWSWNPVTGCLHNCPYCYARDIANRFYEQKFEPTFLRERLAAPHQTRLPATADPVADPSWRRVFTCSMADLFGSWVPREWIDAVFAEVVAAPQWEFLFLTKFPQRLAELDWPDNAWVGTSVDRQHRVKVAEKAFRGVKAGVKWLSCEPLLEPLRFDSLEMFDWVVIGACTSSSGAPEFAPSFDWVVDLYQQARASGCKVYLKHNLFGAAAGVAPGMAPVREWPR